jgi:hypothetical protein
MSGSDKEVGKGRPPKKNRFGRGQRRSSGRPKGARGEKSIVREIAGEVHQVQLNGRKRSVTTFELLLISARDLAMGANLKAARWLNEYRAGLNLEGEAGGFLLVPEVMPIDMLIKQIEFENRYATNPELRDDPLLASRSDS